MKKLGILFLLLFVVGSVLIACGGGDDGPKEILEIPLTENLHGWFDYGSALVLRDEFAATNRDSIDIAMAKNEKEGFQYLLASTQNYDDLRCEVSTLTDGNGNTLTGTVYTAYNLFIRKTSPYNYDRGYRPFALLEQDNEYVGGTFDVVANRSKTLYVQFETDKNTVAGTYTGVLQVKQGDTVLTEGEVSVTVWDIYYEEDTATDLLFGVGYTWWDTTEANGPQLVGPANAPDFKIIGDGTATDNVAICEQFMDFMLDNRLSPSCLFYEDGLLNENAGKYLDDPRVSQMLIADQTNLYLQYEKAVEEGWYDKIIFCQFDEPHEEGHMGHIYDGIRRIKNLFETTQHMNPFYVDLPDGDKNIADRLGEVSTFHCTLSPNFKAGNAIGETLMKLKAERGDTVIWYTCGSNPADTIDLLPTFPGTLQRTLFWQQYLYDIDGYLLWNTTNWYGQDDIWEEDYEEKKHKMATSIMGPTGNGVLIYFDPITKEPVPTLGLQSVRDGIEDYQLFAMAEKVLGREVVLTYITRITTSLTEFNTEAEVLMQVRNELAEALLAATTA